MSKVERFARVVLDMLTADTRGLVDNLGIKVASCPL